MSRHPTARSGKRLGRYRIEAELGRGGMGVVYVATDENTGRRLALKTTTVAGLGSGEKTRNQRRERFIREVRALTQVNHENVVHVFDAGEVDDPDLGWLLFYTMDYVEGTTLAALVQERGPLAPGEASAVVMQVAAGLGQAHRQGIIHRDVKPANIFLSNDGRALIGDFGIAKIEGSTQITRRDQLVGTPNYLAPEQILGETVGPPTDVFALGALFYVITQNRPLRQQVDAASLLASANGNEPMQRALATTLPDGLKRVVARSLERESTRRYVDGTAFAEALADFATRVPPLKDSPPPAFLVESTADRSSAFASDTQSLPDGAAVDAQGVAAAAGDAPTAFGNGADSVEAMARAMLGEVDRRSTGPSREPARAPLPVARTEPTAMFNLRAMEAAAATRPTPSSLPVARSEPDNPFAVRSAPAATLRPPSGALPQRPAIVLERVDDDDDVGDDAGPGAARPRAQASAVDAAVAAFVEGRPQGDTTPAPAVVVADQTAVIAGFERNAARATSSRVDRPARAHRPPPPRHVLVTASLAAGLVAGIVVALAARPASRNDEFAVVRRPELCPVHQSSADGVARGAAFLEEARAQKAAGMPRQRIIEKLRAGIAADPTNAQLFYELGQATTDRAQDDAYDCVCHVAPDSRECHAVEKVRHP